MESLLSRSHAHDVQIYYEDTDHSGAVYHANYLRYLERAREHMFGIEALVELQKGQGVGFVVYKVELTFKDAAHFGDSLQVLSQATRESDYRLRVKQDVVRPADGAHLVEGVVQLACVNAEGSLVALPF